MLHVKTSPKPNHLPYHFNFDYHCTKPPVQYSNVPTELPNSQTNDRYEQKNLQHKVFQPPPNKKNFKNKIKCQPASLNCVKTPNSPRFMNRIAPTEQVLYRATYAMIRPFTPPVPASLQPNQCFRSASAVRECCRTHSKQHPQGQQLFPLPLLRLRSEAGTAQHCPRRRIWWCGPVRLSVCLSVCATDCIASH